LIGATVTIGGFTAPTTFADTNTLKIMTPALPAGAQRVAISKSRWRIRFPVRRLYR
jgi:hypothetical protein